MKKIIALALVIVTVFALTACGKFTCDLCKKERSGKRYKTEALGKEIVICENCNEKVSDVKGFVDGIAGLFD